MLSYILLTFAFIILANIFDNISDRFSRMNVFNIIFYILSIMMLSCAFCCGLILILTFYKI